MNDEVISHNFNSLACCEPCLNFNIDENSIKIKNADLLNLFSISQEGNQTGENNNMDIDAINNINFKFYDTHEFHTLNNKKSKNKHFSLFHSNIESLRAKEDKLTNHKPRLQI